MSENRRTLRQRFLCRLAANRARQSLACGVLALAGLGHAQAAGTAYVRIDLLGYETGKPSRAYLISTSPETAATFEVRDQSGTKIYGADVGASTGQWGSFTVYPLNFSVDHAGIYSVAVSGPLPASSPLFSVAHPMQLYREPLANARRFFANERDGAGYLPSALHRAPAHLHDRAATVYETPEVNGNDLIAGDLVPAGETVDAAGGWWDAGDYLKFVETESYTVAMLLTGIRDFPDQMGAGSAHADFTDEAKFGLRWLLKMWNDSTRKLYYEVGIGIDFKDKSFLSDHDLWRLPELDDSFGGSNPDYLYIRHRPVFAAGPAGSPISPNLAGRLSAAFALCFIDYRKTDLPFAQKCLLAAEHIFALADTSPKKLLTVLPYDFYPETEWRDDLEWGAAELDLALALGGDALPAGLPYPHPAHYLSLAANWAHAYITGPNDAADTLNLYDVAGLAHFDLYRAIDISRAAGGLAVSQADLLADLGRQLHNAERVARADPFRFGFPWAEYDTTAHGVGLSVTASEYAYLGGGDEWRTRAGRWLGNIMGANIWGISLIVGDGENFPKCLQHQVANITGSLTGGRPVLAGAAVEGPNAIGAVAHGFLAGMKPCPADGVDLYAPFTGNGARFFDNQQNYANTEPAIDLTASSPLMFAWRIAGAPQKLIAP